MTSWSICPSDGDWLSTEGVPHFTINWQWCTVTPMEIFHLLGFKSLILEFWQLMPLWDHHHKQQGSQPPSDQEFWGYTKRWDKWAAFGICHLPATEFCERLSQLKGYWWHLGKSSELLWPVLWPITTSHYLGNAISREDSLQCRDCAGECCGRYYF